MKSNLEVILRKISLDRKNSTRNGTVDSIEKMTRTLKTDRTTARKCHDGRTVLRHGDKTWRPKTVMAEARGGESTDVEFKTDETNKAVLRQKGE